jgi:hypothetical protein
VAGACAEWHHALLPSLPDDSDHPRVEVDIGDVQSDELGAADPGGIKQLEEGAGATVPRAVAGDVQEGVDLRFAQCRGQVTLGARRQEGARGVPREDPLATEEAQECADARQLAGGRGFAHATAMEARQERTDHQAVDVPRDGRPSDFQLEVVLELTQVTAIRSNRVGRGVALALQVAQEGCDRLSHGYPA